VGEKQPQVTSRPPRGVGVAIAGAVPLFGCTLSQAPGTVATEVELAVTGIVAVVLAVLVWRLAGRLLADLDAGGRAGVERHWGGLGGAVGGWSMSRTLVVLLALALSLGALVAVLSVIDGLAQRVGSPLERDGGLAASELGADAGTEAGEGRKASAQSGLDSSAEPDVSLATVQASDAAAPSSKQPGARGSAHPGPP
jgi:hypothetical protein